MNWVALKMLTGDRAKYLGIVFGVAFATLLMAQQSAIFCGLMRFTVSQILFYRQNRRVAELIFGKEAVAALGVEAVTEHVTRFTFAALGLAPPINASGAGGKP